MFLKLRMFFVLFILIAFFSSMSYALTVNISYGAANNETIFVGIAPVPWFIIVDTSLPIIGTIFFDDFIITENGFINGTGTIHALVYDGSGISGCEYQYIDVWYVGNYDGSYCTSNNIVIQDGVQYFFNIRATDNFGNVGYGIEKTYTGKASLVASDDISDEDLISVAYGFFQKIGLGFTLLILFLILVLSCALLIRSARHG